MVLFAHTWTPALEQGCLAFSMAHEMPNVKALNDDT